MLCFIDFVRETHGKDVAEDVLLREVARLRDPDCGISEKGALFKVSNSSKIMKKRIQEESNWNASKRTIGSVFSRRELLSADAKFLLPRCSGVC